MSWRGADEPLVRVVPPYVDTYGEVAIKLATKAGLILDPWQENAVIDLLGIDENGRFVCREYAEWVSRQNGKGAILECRMLTGLFLLKEEKVVWTAHEFKTSSQAFLRVRQLVNNLMEAGVIPMDDVIVRSGHGSEMFELPLTSRHPLQQCLFLARSKGSGRGFTGDCVFIDETFGYTHVQDAAVGPTMRARPNAQMVYTSTPPLDGVSGEVMFSLRKRVHQNKARRLGMRDWTAYPWDTTLDDLGKRDDEGKLIINLDDKSKWLKSNPAAGIRIGEEDMETDREKYGDLYFAREFMGIWPREVSAEGGAIDYSLWTSLLSLHTVRRGSCAISVDISPKHDLAAIALFGEGDDEKGHMQLASLNYGTAWVVDKLDELREKLGPIAFCMGRKTYAVLEFQLKEHEYKLPKTKGEFSLGNVWVMDGPDQAAACGELISAISEGSFLCVPNESLNDAVKSAEFREGVDFVTWLRKGSGDVTPLVAATNARHGFTSWKENLVPEEEFFGSWR